MRHVLPWTPAAVSWCTAILLSFTGTDCRIWACSLTAAGVLTLAALLKGIAAKGARAFGAVTRTALSQPPADGPPTGPIPAPVPLEPYRQRGRHATP